MQVATVSTTRPDVRSEIWGWTFEDSSLFERRSHPSDPWKVFIGYTPMPKHIPRYTTVLEMLADGWVLLGPPQQDNIKFPDGEVVKQVTWWLTREV